ncbi:MAG: hypothetical protein NW200_07220 [Hyphomonadaceae bacterium]|nr:hypothetical protein [Hyphomonadaceae bacterium]
MTSPHPPVAASPPPARRRVYEKFADAAWKIAQRFRTQLARTEAADDLADAARLLWWSLPGGEGPLTPAAVAEVRARCAAVAAHAWRVAEAHAARLADAEDVAAPPRPAPSPLDADGPHQRPAP